MKVIVTGKHLDLGDAFQSHAEERVTAAVAKYFDSALEAHVVVRREAHLFHADCSVHVGAGITMQAQGEAGDVYASLDAALERLSKQLRRDKGRRRDHRTGQKPVVS